MSSDGVILPGVLGQIAAVAGERAALLIAHARGGTQIYVPPQPAPDHWLSLLIGHEAALAVADELTCGVGSIRIDLPTGPAGQGAQLRATMDRMIADGRSERDIALATRYTTRTIRRRRAKLGKGGDDRQLALF